LAAIQAFAAAALFPGDILAAYCETSDAGWLRDCRDLRVDDKRAQHQQPQAQQKKMDDFCHASATFEQYIIVMSSKKKMP
jgi:hypothetical protein